MAQLTAAEVECPAEDETPWIEADFNLIAATRVCFTAAGGRYGWEAA
jgi:hypothetical protein